MKNHIVGNPLFDESQYMEDKEQKQQRAANSPGMLYFKCGAIFLLFLLSTVIAACGSNVAANSGTFGNPPVTVTIDLSKMNPTVPGAPDYLCGAWVTNTAPSYNPGSQVPVNMKFVHVVDGMPQGVANATAAVTIVWANGQSDGSTRTTTTDGLAVAYFSMPSDTSILNKNNEITVTFTSPEGTTCTVEGTQAAFFTVIKPSPTAKATATKKNK
jgi:hypothetical protein